MWHFKDRDDNLTEQGDDDLFAADLFGRGSRRGVVAPPAGPERRAALWTRPDRIFDRCVHGAPHETEAIVEELADEGWTLVASPHSDVSPASLRSHDLVVQRALGDGRLAVVRVLGEDVEARALYGPGGLIRPDTLVLRQLEAEYEPGEDVAEGVDAGETVVHLPLLTAHAAEGFSYDLSGPNCVVRWARVPADFSGALDVVVHFHGYKGHNAMRLQEKANASGLDLTSPGVTRPTLGLVPHGHPFRSRMANTDGFDFPAIASRDALRRFIDAGIAAFKTSIGSPPDRSMTAGRVILTGHSGGGAALNRLMGSIGSGGGAHAFHYFDATYGGASVFIDDQGWLKAALRRDALMLKDVSDEAERTRAMRERGGNLRLVFIDGSGTAATARTVDGFIAARLRELVSDEGLRQFLRRYYRAQRVANPRTVYHDRVPRTFGGRLLADGADNLAAEARDLDVARAASSAAPREDSAFAEGLEEVRAAIDATLQSFRNILVSVPPPTGRQIAVQAPYFINRATSPSRLRAEQRRPALLQNEALARLYRGLPLRARIGKAQADDVRSFLQGAADANAIPGQASGVSAEALKGFLSDMGVGIDCSGFVSQALNACMAAHNRTERIDTNSANLRGGAGHNSRQFDVVNRPSDLTPGDTMWKTGHIRIVHRVEPQADGSIQFVTAESSSVSLVGPVAKTWKCPQADRFAGMQVERAGAFVANTEANVFSRYKPLAEALGLARPAPALANHRAPTAAPAPGRPAATPPSLDGAAPAPTASRPAPAPPPPAATPSPAPAGAPASGGQPAVVVPQTLSQADVDRLTAVQFTNGADINTFFSRRGADGFAGWFNATWGGRPPFVRTRGRHAPLTMPTSAGARRHFVAFWDQIPVVYLRPRISAVEFAGLVCIVLNETNGHFDAVPEGARQDLAYFFEAVGKRSYNTLRGNRPAGMLFDNEDYINAHRTLGGADRLAHHGHDWGDAWYSETYPRSAGFTPTVGPENGFIMQADFYKFRGRGVIQTTSRDAYRPIVEYIKGYAGANPVLVDFRRRWTNVAADVAATVSTTGEWDTIFSQGEVLAHAVRLHSDGKGGYLTLSSQAPILLDVPQQTHAVRHPRGRSESIYRLGMGVSGQYVYSSGPYRNRVLGMLNGILALL